MAQKKMTAKQKEARVQAALAREQRAEQKKAAADRKKKIFTVVVCVILVLALGLPTMALALLGA